MVRLSVELLNDAAQYVNPVRDRELNLRNYKIPVIENMGVTRDQFDTIDLTDNDIKKLDNLPLLKRLTTLYLHNNRIHYIQSDLHEAIPNLKTLTLTNNNICELGDIDPLAACTKLEYVTFIGNPITHKEHYRYYVIYRLPSVRVVDFRRVKQAEREEAKRLFKGKKNKGRLAQIGRKSDFAEVDKENQENIPVAVAVAAGTLTEEDREKIKEAIKSAKSLQEVDYLNSVLQSGRIPEKGWNAGLELTRQQALVNGNGQEEGFEPEMETDVTTEEAPITEEEPGEPEETEEPQDEGQTEDAETDEVMEQE